MEGLSTTHGPTNGEMWGYTKHDGEKVGRTNTIYIYNKVYT
jgi:hypothetical protein